ncbi:Bacterio-opsin activator, HTH domain protein [Pyrobaculum islandicum DSM 4184]|uniref:Bacterio-opsin activator, HTH domain protein n=1 Tax=Pyrobaculum islandicum (strain DSM 4184 / JCM 9189 / GEO3) TaxID=384616 RepID=A1RRX8_PYRIL|nr:sigma factor-like helix-turn-helix DNA-binding protein [Pyrobaculum islandicum]ABL87710.1 Bacterio-opsin activator, HTH domain protein [Pyrobaculum islandicum DSM 4184]
MKLTATEKKVAELYSRGLRPREIAETLGISINTVYKALSKARKTLEVVEPPANHYIFSFPIYTYSINISATPVSISSSGAFLVQNLHDMILKKLDEILALLSSERREPRTAQNNTTSNQTYVRLEGEGRNGNGHMPELLKKNIWISLLRNKAV